MKRIGILGLLLFGMILFVLCGCQKDPSSQTVDEICDSIHKAYTGSLSEKKAEKIIESYGLSYSEHSHWNGAWYVDEELIKTYVQKYSAEEFMGVYDEYIASNFGNRYNLKMDIEKSDALLRYINETTDFILSSTDLFNVVIYDPSADTPLDKTSKTREIQGKFNAGKDNHIVYDTTELTTETITYQGYKVEHEYGHRYDSGTYKWVNGKFIDKPASFYRVDEWSIIIGGQTVMREKSSMSELVVKSIDGKYFLRKVDTYYLPIEVRFFTTNKKEIDNDDLD